MSACANKKTKYREITEYFVTDIKEDGSKQFSYSLIIKMPSKQPKGNVRGGHSSVKGGQGGRRNNGVEGSSKKIKGNNSDMFARIENRFYEMLEAKLAATKFCQVGYLTLDSYIDREKSQLRGECHDQAEQQSK